MQGTLIIAAPGHLLSLCVPGMYRSKATPGHARPLRVPEMLFSAYCDYRTEWLC